MNLEPSAATPRAKGRKGPFLFISLAVLVLDQWSKWLVEVHLPHHASQPVIPDLLNLTHVRNTGVAFGLFASETPGVQTLVLTALGLLALSVVAVYFRRVPASHKLLLTALALVLGGRWATWWTG